jgi:hypothetical protein
MPEIIGWSSIRIRTPIIAPSLGIGAWKGGRSIVGGSLVSESSVVVSA